MAGLISFALGGVAFIVVGLHQFLTFLLPSTFFPLALHRSSLALSLLTSLFSLLSLLLSFDDPLSSPLSFSLLAVSLLFSLHSLAALRLHLLPTSVRDIILLFAFLLELLFLKLSQRANDAGGLENRYLELMLVPVGICAAATGSGVFRPRSIFPPLARAVGLIFHGTWLLQMGFSFFTSAIAHACVLHQRSWANYTIKCKGHADYHRGRAVALLQFNCHLAFLVVVALCVYSAVGSGKAVESVEYRPLHQMQAAGGGLQEPPPPQFTSDSEDEEGGKKVVASGGEITS